MRSVYILLLVILSATGVSGRQATVFSALPVDKVKATGHHLPHIDAQLSGSMQLVTPIAKFVKRTNGMVANAAGIAAPGHFYVTENINPITTAPDKDYLSHIYPSLHFW